MEETIGSITLGVNESFLDHVTIIKDTTGTVGNTTLVLGG